MKYYRIIRKKDNMPIVTSASYAIVIREFNKRYGADMYKIVIVEKNIKK